MKPNEIQQLLIDYLRNTTLKAGARATVFMILQTDEQMLEMCRYLSKHLSITAEEAIAKARQITSNME